MNATLIKRSYAALALTGFVLVAGCMYSGPPGGALQTSQQVADRQEIEEVLGRANLGFELSDADMFANAFAQDAAYILDEPGPVFGYDKMIYRGRADIRTIIEARVAKARAAPTPRP